MSEQKNMILAAGLSFLVILVWTMFFAPEPPERQPQEQARQGQAREDQAGRDGDAAPVGASKGPGAAETRAAALEDTERVAIDAGAVSGSISLRGGRLDDLHLTRYQETLGPDSETVTLLSPIGGEHPYYAVYGWLDAGEGGRETPGPNTHWRVESGGPLRVGNPVTLIWENDAGLVFRRTFSIDQRYLFTVEQTVENAGGEAARLRPYGYVAQRGTPDTIGFYILHEGAVAVLDDELRETDYDDMAELPANGPAGARVEQVAVNQSGFVGFTSKYWMTALAPGPSQPFEAVYKFTQTQDGPEYRTEAILPVSEIAPGETARASTMLFAGAKEYQILEEIEEARGIFRFVDSIDWGWFFFLTKPIFQLLQFFQGFIGNMGWSIIALTFFIKLLLFPLAYKSYVSMSKMKKLQPEMEKIKERVGDDRQKMQQEMMALYKKEKANPAAGCLPILLQIPIFFSLYKVLFVSIEMRHEPFIWWIRDLSAPDPTSILNLFGLLPFAAPAEGSFLALVSIGVFPVLMGATMWLQQKLNPAPTDPMQAQIFALMPLLFMFLLGSFASGLVIYWCANNIITIVQQYAIMRSQGVEVDLFGNIKSSLKRKKNES